MQLRDRLCTDDISEDSSAGGVVAVASQPLRRAGRVTRSGKLLRVDSQADGRTRKWTVTVRHSTRSAKVDYKEASSSDEEDEKKVVKTVGHDEDAISTDKSCFSSHSDDTTSSRVIKAQKRVRYSRGADEDDEADGESNIARFTNTRPRRTCTLKSVMEQVEEQTVIEPLKEDEKLSDVVCAYTVGRYGLEVDGTFPQPLKTLRQQVEKILAVNRSSGTAVYCVKLCGASYRSAVNVTEGFLQKNCPQLVRNFNKRLESLGRADGHVGTLPEGPAFDPRYLLVERIIAARQRGKSKKLYVKWRGLPYSDGTWEFEKSMAGEHMALAKFQSKNEVALHPYNLSSAFKDGRSLRDYQKDGVKWLDYNFQRKINCILADEMGLGKTIQSVGMLECLRWKRKRKGPFLIVAPVSTLGHWQREIESLTDINCVVYAGSQEDRAIIQQYEFWLPRTNTPKFTVLLSSFEILMKDKGLLGKIEWNYVIIDEAHRLKSRESKTSSALGCMSVKPGGLLLLTGTPIQNNTKELFNLLSFLDPEEFQSEESFMDKYGNIKDIEQVKDLQENVLKPRLLRRMKEDVEKSIPLKEETIIWVELTKDQRAYYRAIYENRVADLLKGLHSSNMPNLRNMAMELRKLCNHPFLCDGLEEDFTAKSNNAEILNLVQSSGKMVLLDKLLPMLRDSNRRVLIFSQFTIMLDILEDYLSAQGYTFERIDGNIRGLERQAAIDRYSASDSRTFAFLLSTRAGGVGITLTAADTCIIYDSDWNPQNDLQAMARCHRIGQTKDVKVYRLITRNTYEQHLFECSSRKYGLDEAVLGKFEADQPDLNKNIESLLRHGAYEILKEDGEAEAAAFGAENINHILEQRTQRRMIGGRGNNTFSVATFTIEENDSLDVPAEDFWKNVLPEACERKGIGAKDIVTVGPRKRRKVDYVEDEHISDSDHDLDASSSDAEKKSSTIELQDEESGKTWSARELIRLERSLSVYGTLQPRAARSHAGLEYRDISEIEEATQAIVQLCRYVQSKADNFLSESNEFPKLPPSVGILESTVFMGRWEKNAKRYLQIYHECEVIDHALKQQNFNIGLSRAKKLPLWWGGNEDWNLLQGVHCYGHKDFKSIRMDPSLCFAGAEHDDWPSDYVLSSRVKSLVRRLEFVNLRNVQNVAGKSPGLKHRQKRVLSERPDEIEPVEPAIAVYVDQVPNSSSSDEDRCAKRIKSPSSNSKAAALHNPFEKQAKGSKKLDQSANKENMVPRSIKRKSSGSKQQSLLGYLVKA